MPRARFYGAVAVDAVVFYYAGTSEVAWLYLLAYWVPALIVASFLYQLWNRGFRGEIFVRGYKFAAGSPMEDLPEAVLNARPLRRAFEGDSILLDLRLVSSRGTRGPARMTGSVAGGELASAAGLVSKRGWTEQKVVGPVRRGPVSQTGWRLYAGDLLGLYSDDLGNRTEGGSEIVLVLPRFASLGSRHRVRELEASAAAARAGTGTELFGVREYRPGDPPRRIHWAPRGSVSSAPQRRPRRSPPIRSRALPRRRRGIAFVTAGVRSSGVRAPSPRLTTSQGPSGRCWSGSPRTPPRGGGGTVRRPPPRSGRRRVPRG